MRDSTSTEPPAGRAPSPPENPPSWSAASSRATCPRRRTQTKTQHRYALAACGLLVPLIAYLCTLWGRPTVGTVNPLAALSALPGWQAQQQALQDARSKAGEQLAAAQKANADERTRLDAALRALPAGDAQTLLARKTLEEKRDGLATKLKAEQGRLSAELQQKEQAVTGPAVDALRVACERVRTRRGLRAILSAEQAWAGGVDVTSEVAQELATTK
ncbi:MAG TPA: OmpH family outer membrane protein [Armatimonadota bacterium]|jgi:Skp family chaperone for outer membrane proteins